MSIKIWEKILRLFKTGLRVRLWGNFDFCHIFLLLEGLRSYSILEPK